MSYSSKIVIVEDDFSFASFLKLILTEEGYDVRVFNDPEEALSNLKSFSPHLVITDLKMPKMDGISFMLKAKELISESSFLIITAFGTIPSAVEAIKKGAIDYVTKPLSSPEDFVEKIKKILKNKIIDPTDIPPFEILFAGIEDVYKNVKEVAPTDATVMLYGETGTGKSAIAKAIHLLSGKKGSFIEINCASIPESLIESELFGYEKGAFSGAVKTKPGKIELAEKGTLFLDEISELTLSVQAKFLKVLQDKTFERLGGLQSIKADVRFIAATNRDLKLMVKEGKFRQDLYFRLNVFPVYIKPLRERREHILKIAYFLIKKLSTKLGKDVKSLSESSKKFIKSYSFPGNIRELENLLERAIILSNSETIEIRSEENFSDEADDLKTIEKKAIVDALNKAEGNKKKAAEILGISLRTLYYKIKEYGLK